MPDDPTVPAALRVWLDTPNLMASYERHGIVIGTISLRVEAAKAVVVKLDEMLSAPEAYEPERVETIGELLDMVREALSGGPGQVLPLTREDASPLDDLFGAVS